jgi:hypothetical protein
MRSRPRELRQEFHCEPKSRPNPSRDSYKAALQISYQSLSGLTGPQFLPLNTLMNRETRELFAVIATIAVKGNSGDKELEGELT